MNVRVQALITKFFIFIYLTKFYSKVISILGYDPIHAWQLFVFNKHIKFQPLKMNNPLIHCMPAVCCSNKIIKVC